MNETTRNLRKEFEEAAFRHTHDRSASCLIAEEIWQTLDLDNEYSITHFSSESDSKNRVRELRVQVILL